MPKAITDKDSTFCWMLLIDAFAQIRFNKRLKSVHAVINGGTIGVRAEAIFHAAKHIKGEAEESFDRLRVHSPANLSIGRAGSAS